MEFFAGSARLTSSLGSEGFDSFGVDHVVSKHASGSILQLDLNDPQSVEHLWRILRDPAVKYIHCAPPCGTAARARDIQFPGAPAVLRTVARPQGIEGLEGVNALRVAKANALYSLVLDICKFCIKNNKYFSCEHPSRSYLWLLPEWKQFMNQSDVRQTFSTIVNTGETGEKAPAFSTTSPNLNIFIESVQETMSMQVGESSKTNGPLPLKRRTRGGCAK